MSDQRDLEARQEALLFPGAEVDIPDIRGHGFTVAAVFLPSGGSPVILSRASSYALYALACLARQGGGPLATWRISQEQRLPERFLAKILKPLVSARVLVSMRGPYGGYRLDRRPEDVTVLEVIEAIDGPVRGEAPPPEPQSRRFPHYGPADAEWTYEVLNELCKAAADRLRQSLSNVTVADLLEQRPDCDLGLGEETWADRGTEG